ncbi:MAG TPA: membrane protein insertase YidC [Vicinamibacterales bacterium]|nr:membrane protein insertase YidC [Vicinamibacterales bacterium]
MERRIFLAIILAAVVMYGWQAFFMPPPPAPRSNASQQAQAPAKATATPAPAAQAPSAQSETKPSAEAPVQAVKGEQTEREIVVDTAVAKVVLTNRGGRVLHWQLKDYRTPAGELVDLVPSNIPADQPRPFSLRVDDPQVTQRLDESLYQVRGDSNGRVDATKSSGGVTFEFEDAAGLRVRKELRFEPRNFVVSFSADVHNGEMALNPWIAWGPGLGDLGAMSSGGSYFTGNSVQPPQAIFHRDGDVERLKVDAVTKQPTHEGQFGFAGIDDHYFVAALVNPGQARLEFKPVSISVPGRTTPIQFLSGAYRLQKPHDVRVYVGPKQFDLLRAVDPELVRAINFGMFSWMVVPLLSALKWLFGFLGNYGWAIVVLTILLNLVLFYPRHRSVVAMRKMQAIQPEMKAIQDRYANLKATDPAKQKMNTEVMNLYRERGVNPASGCVPMLLTMPVLLAFYSLLSMSIELRGAPFVGWIHDLSAPDPYFVIPLLMGITMFWQQRISPTSADPTQQRVMMIMPIMFTAMMAFSPSGVVLYWTVSQLWAIGQQYLTNRLIGPPVVATVRRGK